MVERGQIDGYSVIYEQTPHNWSAYSPDLPGCISTGKIVPPELSEPDAFRNLKEVRAAIAVIVARMFPPGERSLNVEAVARFKGGLGEPSVMLVAGSPSLAQ